MVIKSHSCPQNITSCVSVYFGPSVSEDWDSWILSSKFYADQNDVDAGEADYVGEEMSSSEIAINYCPFCGCALNEDT